MKITFPYSDGELPEMQDAHNASFSTLRSALLKVPKSDIRTATSPATVDTPFLVFHSLGVIPDMVTGMLGCAGSVYVTSDDRREWTSKQVSIRCSVSNASIVVSITSTGNGASLNPPTPSGTALAANQVLASPSAAGGDPKFRALTSTDIPTLDTSKLSDLTSWTTPTFSAGDYTGNGAMTWTVASGNVTTFQYFILGKLMLVSFIVVATTVGGTPNTTLQLTIPASKTATSLMRSYMEYSDAGAALVVGKCVVQASGTVLQFVKIDASNWTASASNTAIRGQIFFQIN